MDIYGNNKGNTYVSPRTNLFKAIGDVTAPALRVLHKKERERFIHEMGKVQSTLKIRGWLTLANVLTNMGGNHNTPHGGEKEQQGVDARYLAITQFYRGAWGKAYKTLTGGKKPNVNVKMEQVMKLYPRRPEDRHIDVECPLGDKENKQTNTVTGSEVRRCLDALPRGKAAGHSGMTYDVIK